MAVADPVADLDAPPNALENGAQNPWTASALTRGKAGAAKTKRRYRVTESTMRPGELLIDGDDHAPLTVVLAHSAGAPMDSPFMNRVARGLSEAGHRVVRFEFPYMAARRRGGGRGAPDREGVLRSSWLGVIEGLGGGPRLAIGGKSMGGRYATMVADEVQARGVVCFGYPFHPPGQPEKLRTAHLEGNATPTLILQGTRDTFGTREEVEGYALSPRVHVRYIEEGDHSFKPARGTGRTAEENLAQAISEAAAFLEDLAKGRRADGP